MGPRGKKAAPAKLAGKLEKAGKPGKLDKPGKFGKPGKAEKPGKPGKAGKPGNFGKGKPDKAGKAGKGGKPPKDKKPNLLEDDDDDDAASVVREDDWLGAAGGSDEEPVAAGSDSDAEVTGDDADGLTEAEDSGAEGQRAGRGARPPQPDDEDMAAAHGSRALARIQAGGPGDLSALKQQIHDDVEMLTNWRKYKELGETRSRDEVFSGLVGNCASYFGYAEELAEYFLQMFSPDQALKFFEANERPRPLTIRTNSLKTRRTNLMQALTARKVHVDPVGTWSKVGLKIYESAVPVGATPEYLGGHYMIQSASSFIPVMALAPQENEVVLDMAAAPGGKTTYIGQLMRNTGTIFANDIKRERCKALVANIHRMGLTNVIVTNMDGRKLLKKLPKMDRVLLDAPCTGSGIIARDPSVKVKRGANDFLEHSKQQKELLQVAVDMVDARSKTGGYIVYSTCSVSVEENEAVIDYILSARNVELVSFESSVNFGVEGYTKFRERRFHPTMNLCRRYFPHVHNMDGFFVAKLKKTSNDIPQKTPRHRQKAGETPETWGEDKWTPEAMESVMSFEKEDKTKPIGKGLNKKERKKLKRAEQLKQREAKAKAEAKAAAAAGKAAAGSATASDGAGEKPQDSKPSQASKAKLKKARRQARAAAKPSDASDASDASDGGSSEEEAGAKAASKGVKVKPQGKKAAVPGKKAGAPGKKAGAKEGKKVKRKASEDSGKPAAKRKKGAA